MSRKKFIDALRFNKGFIYEHPELDLPEDAAARGSRNVLFTGEGEPVPFKGLSLVGGIGAITGEQVGGGIGGFNIPPTESLTNEGTVCANAATVTIVSDGTQIQKLGGVSSYDTGYASAGSITNSGTLKFRFLTNASTTNGSRNGLSLRNRQHASIPGDPAYNGESAFYRSCCSATFTTCFNSYLLPQSFGVELIYNPLLPGYYAIATAYSGSSNETTLSIAQDLSDVWTIIVDGSAVEIYQNSTLVESGTKDDTVLHVHGSHYEPNSGSVIQLFSPSILRP